MTFISTQLYHSSLFFFTPFQLTNKFIDFHFNRVYVNVHIIKILLYNKNSSNHLDMGQIILKINVLEIILINILFLGFYFCFILFRLCFMRMTATCEGDRPLFSPFDPAYLCYFDSTATDGFLKLEIKCIIHRMDRQKWNSI